MQLRPFLKRKIQIQPVSKYRLAWAALGLCVGLSLGSVLAWLGAGALTSTAVALVGLLTGPAFGRFLASSVVLPGLCAAGRHRAMLTAVAPLWTAGFFAFAALLLDWAGLAVYGFACCAAAALALALQQAGLGRSERFRNMLAAGLIVASVIAGLALFYQGVFVHDAAQYRAQLMSIFSDRDLVFYDNVCLNDVFRTYNPFPHGSARYMGTCLAEFPFWLAGIATQALRGLSGTAAVRNAPTDIALMVTAAGSVFYGAAGLVLCWIFLRHWFSRGASLAAVLLCAWASPLPFFMFSWNGWPHPISFCLVAAFLVFWVKTRESTAACRWAGLGMLAGMIALVRPVDAITCAVAFPDLVRLFGRGRLGATCLSVFILAAAAAFLPQMVLWKAVSGAWLSTPYAEVGDRFRWLHPDVAGLLFSPERHGLVAWHPVFAAGLAGLVLFIQKDRQTALAATGAVLAAVYVLSSWSVWWTGTGFGNRFFIGFLPLFGLGLARIAELFMARIGAAWTAAVGGALAAGNLLLMCAYLVQAVPQGIPEDSLVTDRVFSFVDLARFMLGTGRCFAAALTEGALGQGPPVPGRLIDAVRCGDAAGAAEVLVFCGVAALGIAFLTRAIVAFFSLPGRIRAEAERAFPVVGAALAIAASAWIAFACKRPGESARFSRLEFEPAVIDRMSGPFNAPVLCPFPVTAVDVINALQYAHGAAQGEPVAVITVTDAGGASYAKTLRAGIDTAETSFLRPEHAAALRHGIEGLEIARARMCRAFSLRRYPLLVFRSTFDLPEPTVIRSVRIEYVSDSGRMTIEDVFVRDFQCR